MAGAGALSRCADRKRVLLFIEPAKLQLAAQLAQTFCRCAEGLMCRDQRWVQARICSDIRIPELLREGLLHILPGDQAQTHGGLTEAHILLTLCDDDSIDIDLGELAGVEQQSTEQHTATFTDTRLIFGDGL